jgi:hypothetical protein
VLRTAGRLCRLQRGRRYWAFLGSFGRMLSSIALCSGSFGQAVRCSCSNVVFTMVLPLASFAQNVKNGCATELTQAAVDGAAKPRSVGRVKRDRLRHVPAFACKYNRWKSESALPCKQQEIYREIFSRKLNRQNLARTRASRPGFHPAAKASGGGPPHDIPSSQRAKNNPRRGNPHRGSNTIM